MSTNFSQCGNFEPSFPLKVTLIVFLSVVFALSLVGNAVIIIVVYKRPELRKTVNYFIVNMALSDFVFPLISIPESVRETAAGYWEWPIDGITGLILCKLRNFLMSVSLTVSIESLVWIAFDRFVAVVWPMKARLISSRFRVFAISSTWIFAVGLNCLDLYSYTLISENGTISCDEDSASPSVAYRYTRVTVAYIGPMILITVLYSAIAVTLRRRNKMLQCRTAQRTDHKKRQAIKMSLCIVALFYLFFLPFVVTLALWETLVSLSCSFFNHFIIFSSTVVYISSTTNPIICFAFVESYRRGLREVLSLPLLKSFGRTTIATTAGGREEIILKRIKVISGIESNPAFSET